MLHSALYQSAIIVITTKIGTYGNKVYTKFRVLNELENNIECESFTVTSIDSLLVYENKYLDDYAYKIVNKEMTDFLDEKIFD